MYFQQRMPYSDRRCLFTQMIVLIHMGMPYQADNLLAMSSMKIMRGKMMPCMHFIRYDIITYMM